jgi:hypothetical protein
MKIGMGTPPGTPRPRSHRVCLSDEVEEDRRGTSAPVRAGTSDWSTLAVAQVLELVDDVAVGIP